MAKEVGSGNSLTYTEVHAAILGVVVGVLSGFAYSTGRTEVAVGLASFFVGVSLGVGGSGELPAAQRTVRREPWYALAAFLAGGVAGVVVV
ncbi:hypothetical protein [Halorussus halophilus]|uniref:hypothetical protein n=1 Tax=Halorussus halophilus TaxID=2650975 RepID=UPI00130159F4|nr:hypothetical protein [Halorussus halophilus]